MSSREEFIELHGEEFVENFEAEFEIPPEDVPTPASYKVKEFLYFFKKDLQETLLTKRYVWYLAGLVDGLIVYALVDYLTK